MALTQSEFASFVRSNLEKAANVGVALGTAFNNIAFFNALRSRFPILTASQVGALMSTAISASRAAREQNDLPPTDVLGPNQVPVNPGLIGADPGALVFQYSVTISFHDPITGRTHFRSELIKSAHPISPNDLLFRAFEALQELLDESPPDDDAEPSISGGVQTIVNLVLRSFP